MPPEYFTGYAAGTGTGAAPSFAFQDNFTDTDGVDLDAHTPDVDESGNGWTSRSGNFEIQNNKAEPQGTAGAADYLETFDTGSPDGTLQADVTVTGGTAWAGLAFRWSDNNNFWRVIISAGGTGGGYLQKRVAGSYVTAGRWGTASARTAAIRVEISGDNIQVFEDGAIVLDVEENFNNTATAHGLFSQSTAIGAAIDNLSFDETADLQSFTTAFADTFPDTNGTDLDAHTPDTDLSTLGWSQKSGTIEIQSNKAVKVGTSPGGPLFVSAFDGGDADGILEADCEIAHTGTTTMGLVWRYQDNDNLWAILVRSSTSNRIMRRASGAWNEEDSWSPNGDAAFRITFFGDNINVYQDGVWVAYAVNSAFNTETEHGIRLPDDTTATVDNLVFKR